MRKAKAIQTKSRACEVNPVDGKPNTFNVTSSTSGKTYQVYINVASQIFECTCDWAMYHQGNSGCSHVVAAINAQAKVDGKSVSAWTPETAQAQHRATLAQFDGLVITQRSN